MSFRLSRMFCFAALGAFCLGLAGCDWETSSDSYNSRYNFLNFSGVYRGVNGGLLVTDYSSELSSPSGEGSIGTTNNVASEQIATGNGVKDDFAGSLDQNNIIPGSLSIEVQGNVWTFTDPAPFEGVLVAAEGASGNINYDTGAWSLNFNGTAPDNGVKIVASYKYFLEPESTDDDAALGTGSGVRGNATSGVSGAEIYAFNVEHYGNKVRITDNNGKVYDGSFGDIRSAGGVNQDGVAAGATPLAGDTYVANFSAEGVSAAGKKVRLAGNFQGLIQSADGSTAVLDDRLMLGTWIESNGRTGDINGEASPITITIPTSTTTTP